MYSSGLYAVQNTPAFFFRALKAHCLYPVTNVETESNINKGIDVQSQTFINTARDKPQIQNVSPVARLCFLGMGWTCVHYKVLRK